MKGYTLTQEEAANTKNPANAWVKRFDAVIACENSGCEIYKKEQVVKICIL